MARLFISHSSRNNDKAIEVRDWLATNGWDDVFLDLDPERGIVAGQRWKEALQKAAHRCEVVLALISADWLASGWCKSELDAARLMGKKIIVALIGIDKSQVPLDLADEQWIDLAGDPLAYRRLKEGLRRVGLDPSSFPFEPGRRPYPGFAYLEEKDAAVFFGRDAQIVRGLDEIRRLVRTGVSRMLVILGASGSGKSSFLRAGLWPRLNRDDRAWLPLPIIRPERAVISGKYGLAQALQQTMSEAQFADGIRQRGLPRSRADIQDFIEKTEDGLVKLLSALRDLGQVSGLSGENTMPPTIVLAIDQGEELFNEEGRDEDRRFVKILTSTLKADPRTFAILVVRSGSFPLLQADTSLAAVPKDTFTLDMMLEGSYREVIEGPARLVEPTPLRIDPQLTDALLEDISGQDALPLLAFTLAHLYEQYAADNELSLSGYDKLGRLKGVIDTTVKQAFAEGVAKGDVPNDVKAQLALARAAFIPHLAQVNAAREFVRRVATRDEIPAEARPLIDRFADQRLLIKDRRKDVEVVEVAHEALLRHPPFSEWLTEDREFLVWRERLSQARAAFEANERGLLAGRELQIARGWMQTRAKDDIELADQAFIRDSIAEDDKRRAEEAERERKRQAAEKEEQERRIQDAERIAAEQKKAAAAHKRTTQVTLVGLGLAVFLLVLVFGAMVWAFLQHGLANTREAEAQTYLNAMLITQSRSLMYMAEKDPSDHSTRILLALEALPDAKEKIERPVLFGALKSFSDGLNDLRELAVAVGHADAVNGVAVMPDGARIVTGSSDRTARIWDAKTGAELLQLKGHTGAVNDVAVMADGARIVTGSEDNTARVWDAQSGAEVLQLKVPGTVVAVAVTADGARIVTGSTDKTARIWDAKTGAELLQLKGHAGTITAVAVTPDGARIVIGFDDNTARVWDASTGTEPLQLKGHTGAVNAVAVMPDGTRIITGSGDNTARVWDARTGAELLQLKGHSGSVRGVAVMADGTRILTGSDDNTARVWNASTGAELFQLKGHADAVSGVAVMPDGTHIVTGSKDNTARVWDARAGAALLQLKGHAGAVKGVAVTPNGGRIVTGSADKTARVWDARTGTELLPLKGHEGAVNSVAVMPDGGHIVTASTDKTARIWDAKTGAELLQLKGHTGAVLAVAVMPDGARIVTGSTDKTARIWDAKTGAELLQLKGHTGAVNGVAVMPDGARIVTGSVDKTARVWDAQSGAEVLQLKGPATVFAVAVTADGARIVTGSSDRTARTWDAKTGAELLRLRGHTGYVNGVTVTPDGTRIVTSSSDRTVRIWDARTGAELAQAQSPTTGVFNVAGTPDGARVVTGSQAAVPQLWDLAQLRPPPPQGQFSTADARQALVDRAKAVVPRCLTIKQRQDFFLRPTPPPWCIEMRKYPYDTKAWKAWKAGNTADAVDSMIASAFGDLADKALKEAADFPKALEAANLGIAFGPKLIWIRINKAHALMFLGREKEARTEYLVHRGTMIPDKGLWEQVVVDDFSELRNNFRDHPLMAEIEQLFKRPVQRGE